MLNWLRKLTSRIIRGATTSKPSSWLVDWIRGDQDSETGVSIDGKSALRYAPVWNAVNRICGRVAQLPILVYQQTGERTKVRAVDHPAYRLLKRQPNRIMTPATFKELVTYHAMMWGNGRAAIIRNPRADPIELVPLLPGQSRTVIVNGEKWHVTEVTLDSGEIVSYKFRDADVLHVMGLGYDGVQGYALWDLAKGSWGLGLATEKNSARLFRNQTIPGLILEAPPGVFADDEEAKKFLAAFRGMHEGLDNVGKTALLREGIKASKLSQSGQEAQAIEQRAFQREEAGLWFMLESMLGIDSSVSYNSLEQKQLAELINCLNPWLVKWQEQCEAKLLREREIAADSHFVRFNTGALLRSDTRTTYQTLAEGVRGRLITPNEARAVLDMDPLPGGDELQNPAIDVKKSPEPGDESLEPDADDGAEPIKKRLRAAIVARLQDLVAVERQRVLSALAKGDRFVPWLDEFYERWENTLESALQPLVRSDSPRIAAEWVAESRADLRRGGNLGDTMAGWDDRAEKLADVLV